MVISGRELTKYICGAVSAIDTADGTVYSRFTEKQKEAFGKRPEKFPELPADYFQKNCDAQAGILLDLVTDSRKIAVTVKKLEGVNGAESDICATVCDGTLPPKTIYGAGKIEWKRRTAAKRRLRIYFPYFGRLVIESIEMDDSAVVGMTPTKKGLLLCIGDSITHGVHAAHPENTYVCRLGDRLGYEVINQGNSGYVYDADAIIDRICDIRTGKEKTPDIITVACGINDIGRKTEEENRRDMIAFYKKLFATFPKSKIVMVKPTFPKPLRIGEKRREMDRIFADVAAQIPTLTVVNTCPMVPNIDDCFQEDGVHLTDRGFGLLARGLERELIKILEG